MMKQQDLENIRLIEAYNNPTVSAKDKEKIAEIIILENSALATSAVKKFAPQYLGTEYFEDLTQVAKLAIFKCLSEYDPQKGASPSTFFYHKMHGAITEEMSTNIKQSSVHYNMYSCKIRAAQEELAAKGEPVTARRISDHLGVSISTVQTVLQSEGMTQAIPLSELMVEPGSEENVENNAIDKIDSERIARALKTLPEDMEMCVRLSFGFNCEPKSNAEIAKILNADARFNKAAKDKDTVPGRYTKRTYSPYRVETLIDKALMILRDMIPDERCYSTCGMENLLKDFKVTFDLPLIMEEIAIATAIENVPSA